MKVVSVTIDINSYSYVYLSEIWNLSDPGDIYQRIDAYINIDDWIVNSWGTRGTLDEHFLTIF